MQTANVTVWLNMEVTCWMVDISRLVLAQETTGQLKTSLIVSVVIIY
jgi:hypothetical protein